MFHVKLLNLQRGRFSPCFHAWPVVYYTYAVWQARQVRSVNPLPIPLS